MQKKEDTPFSTNIITIRAKYFVEMLDFLLRLLLFSDRHFENQKNLLKFIFPIFLKSLLKLNFLLKGCLVSRHPLNKHFEQVPHMVLMKRIHRQFQKHYCVAL